MRPEISRHPFDPDDLLCLQDTHHVPEVQAALSPVLTDRRYGRSLAVPGLAFTAMRDGKVLGCAGVVPQHDSAAIGWAMPGAAMTPRDWAVVTPMVREILYRARDRGYRRIEAQVYFYHDRGHLWARRLGFVLEGIAWRGLPPSEGNRAGGHMAVYSWQPEAAERGRQANEGLPNAVRAILELLSHTMIFHVKQRAGLAPLQRQTREAA